MKKKLEISPLPTVKNILEDLDSLEYSTQKLNITYQMQLYHFFLEMYNEYDIKKGLRNIFVYQICCSATIIEGLLYCSLRQEGIDLRKQGKYKKTTALINVTINRGLINEKVQRNCKISLT